MDFHVAISQAQTLYDVEGDQEDLEEIGLIAYKNIGNKNTLLKRVTIPIVNGVVTLPCDINIIEAVTYCHEDFNYTNNLTYDGSAETEEYIESQKAFTDSFYMSGKFVKYRKVKNKLYINQPCGHVNILYHTELDDDLPDITESEADAIALYIAYTLKYKEALKTHNQIILAESKDLGNQWKVACDQARVPEYMSQNDMDQALNAKTSWDRKQYNKSFKPIR